MLGRDYNFDVYGIRLIFSVLYHISKVELYLQGGGRNFSPIMTLKHDQPSLWNFFIKSWDLRPLSLGLGFVSGRSAGYNEKHPPLICDPGFKQPLASTAVLLGRRCLLQEPRLHARASWSSQLTLLLCLQMRVSSNMPAIEVSQPEKGSRILSWTARMMHPRQSSCARWTCPIQIRRKDKWLLFEPLKFVGGSFTRQ